MLAVKGLAGIRFDYVEIVKVGKDRGKSFFRYNAGYKKGTVNILVCIYLGSSNLTQ